MNKESGLSLKALGIVDRSSHARPTNKFLNELKNDPEKLKQYLDGAAIAQLNDWNINGHPADISKPSGSGK
jgi:hypothetical protein